MKSILREFFLGFIRIHILHHAAIEPVFGQQFNEELARHGYQVSYGTLYPIFHDLERAGYLTCEKRTVNGRIRKYYTITDAGAQVLTTAKSRIRELVREVLGEAGEDDSREP